MTVVVFVYSKAASRVYILIYVDDIIITGNDSKLIQTLVSRLNSEFSLKDLGDFDYFLGLEVSHRTDGSLTLTQSKYLRNLLAKTTMDEVNPIASPMVGGCKLSKSGSETFSDPTLYRSVVGALQYATITRPKLCFSVNKVCQFMFNPFEQHWQAVKRIIRYLNGTLIPGLRLQPSKSSNFLSKHTVLLTGPQTQMIGNQIQEQQSFWDVI